MTPIPQDPLLQQRQAPQPLDGDRVVITGMSGLYPESHNVDELSRILYNKENPVNAENIRWKYSHPEVGNHTGKVPGLDLFDAQFFKVHYRLAYSMDIMARKILEQTFQAIYDSGISPKFLDGKKVGVYIGTCFSETEKASFYVANTRTGFGIAGCCKAMFANRISYWMNAKGPSFSIDVACCSSTAAVEHAYLAIKRGDCEAAIVGGANVCLHPQSSVHYGRIMTLSKDGKTKSFDQNCEGVAKSEAINVLFMQKAKDAKRVYAEVVHVKHEFGTILMGETGPRYGFYRDPNVLANFIRQFYKEANISPQQVEYIEAFGSAVPEADKAELQAISDVYCKDRVNPLLVGSVMSNIGYTEAACGISAITKVLLGYHHGKLAANLHCETPRQDIPAIRDGRMSIITEHQPISRQYIAINSMSVTGVNAHVLLHGHYKAKDLNRYACNIPRLVTISGRQDTSVKKILDHLKANPVDPEQLALFHNLHKTNIPGHLGRGFTILDTKEGQTVSLVEKAAYFDDLKRPLWFVYSGMGSQWAGMGTQLMRIPIFAAAIERCRKVLEPKGVDIVDIITSTDKTIFDNILHSFVGIAAVQIGLTDILRALGLVPDKIIGHSVGELGCAYADGCFTAEEMILSAYSRGLVSVQTPFIRGSMAAVGIGYQQVKGLCPPEIEVACHNGQDSSTISGPSEIMKEFVAELTAKGIFAKEVPCSNIAYHSRYIAEAGPGLLKYLSEVIKDPKPRSERWVSTSVPMDRWNEPSAKYSSAEYHTNNLLNPVLFEETSSLIPPTAVLVEIAPHGLLQAILKRSLPVTCRHVPLTRRGHADNTLFLLEAIGKLYMDGYYPIVEAIYPKVEFPVSTGTPHLSHLVEWAHHEKWPLPLYVSAARKVAAACKFTISIHDEEYSYLEGHVIRGKTLLPFSAALIAAWDTLAMHLGKPRKSISVQYRDVELYAQPTIHDRRQLRLAVNLHRGTGRFEIMDDHFRVATGYINELAVDVDETYTSKNENTELTLQTEDVYQLLNDRDYSYRGDFQSIYNTNTEFTAATIKWSDNWATFIDGILQLCTLKHAHDTTSQPSHIRNLLIDVDIQKDSVVKKDSKLLVKAKSFEVHDYTRCGGVIIESLRFHDLPHPKQNEIALKSLKFIPRFQEYTEWDIATTFNIFLQIVEENITTNVINVVGIVNYLNEDTWFKDIVDALETSADVKLQYTQINKDRLLDQRDHFVSDVKLVLVQDLCSDDDLCQHLYRVLPRGTFLVNGVMSDSPKTERPSSLFRVISAHKVDDMKLELVRWRPVAVTGSYSAVSVRSEKDLPILSNTRDSLPPQQKLIVLASYPPQNGLKDLVKLWKQDTDRNQIYVFMINEKNPDDQFFDQLPNLDLVFNVLNNGIWGGEYLVPCNVKLSVDRGVKMEIAQIGNIDSLRWVELSEPTGYGHTVTVDYAGLNDIDVKNATGVLPFEHATESNQTYFGMDFSGRTDNGQRVMGLIQGGSVSRRVLAQPELLWPVPDHWSLEDAATVPLAYAIVYYCIGMRTNLLPSASVLVHGGAGALGQAAISVALACKCKVFTTVSDVRKKKFLKRLFPELRDEYIGNSRDASFGDMVLNATKGQGCDIVMSCVRGNLRNTALLCAGNSGFVFDTVKISSQENYMFGMYHLTKERSYVSVDLSTLFTLKDTETMNRLQTFISEGISSGFVRPLSRVTFDGDEAPRAFRLIAASRHRGRVLLRIPDGKDNAEPRLNVSSGHTHMIISHNDYLAVRLAEKLVSRGVKKIYFHTETPTGYLQLKAKSLKALGVQIEVSSQSIADHNGVSNFLNKTSQLGLVEGIYVVAGDVIKNDSVLATFISNIDLVAKKSCPTLRYFAVLNPVNSIGQQTCISRNLNKLPATMIQLPALAKEQPSDSSSKQYTTWRDIVDATERALCTNEPVVSVSLQKDTPISLLEEIAAITDINIPEEVDENATLEELGLPLEKNCILCAYLKDAHNVFYSGETVQFLTIQKIKEIEATLYPTEYKKQKGLNTFINYVDPDELLATTELVFLPTLTNNATMRDDEFDIGQKYLCLLPGLEGHHYKFEALCERLKLPALVLQPGLDNLYESIQEQAQRYAKILLQRSEIKDSYYLLGYESGALAALETAAILEDHGLTGTIFCVGCALDELQTILNNELSEYETEEQLQDAVLKHMVDIMSYGENIENLDNLLKTETSWKSKIDMCVRKLLGRVSHSAQYARAQIEAVYARIQQVKNYRAIPHKLQSKIVLIRAASDNTMPTHSLLQQFSHQPVAVHLLKNSLEFSTKDLRCASIINQYLDPEILEAYEQKNLCETYLLNADTFMSTVEDGV